LGEGEGRRRRRKRKGLSTGVGEVYVIPVQYCSVQYCTESTAALRVWTVPGQQP